MYVRQEVGVGWGDPEDHVRKLPGQGLVTGDEVILPREGILD